jgi:hypothetical protein
VGSLIGSSTGSVEKQTVKGAEFQLDLKRNDALAFVNGSVLFDPVQDLVDESTGTVRQVDLLGISRAKMNLGASYTLTNNLHVSLLYSLVDGYDALSGDRSISEPVTISSSGSLRASLHFAGYKVGDASLKGFVTVNNLTDSQSYFANIRRSGPHVFLQGGRSVMIRATVSY